MVTLCVNRPQNIIMRMLRSPSDFLHGLNRLETAWSNRKKLSLFCFFFDRTIQVFERRADPEGPGL